MNQYTPPLNWDMVKTFCFCRSAKGNVLVVAITCLCLRAVSQPTTTESRTLPGAPVAYTIQQYQAHFGKTLLLYSGAEYIRPFPLIKDHPFLEKNSMQKGTVYFDGVLYPDVMLAYDIVSQQLITTGFQNINLTLVPQKIGYFYLADRLFIPIRSDSMTDTKRINGFCEVLYNNELLVLAHYQKAPKRSSGTDTQTDFATYTTYYMKKDQALAKINNDKALVAALKDQKDRVKQFMRNNKLKFKRAPAETLIKVADYYTHLKKEP